MSLPRFVLAGTNSNVGKTTFTLGILKALSNRGLNVQPFKSGPDYIDPAFHTHVTGNQSRNLDCWMLEEDVLRGLYKKNAKGKDVAIIEGVMGLYDGFSTVKDCGSTAHLSKIIDAPVVLIIDGSGISSSAAAVVLGFVKYDEEVNIQGIIINKVHGEGHYNLLKTAIERDTGVKCYGYMNVNRNIGLDSRHLGLIPSVEVADLDKKIEIIADMVEETVDLDGLIELSKSASPLNSADLNHSRIVENVRIGVAYDKAFNFYYKDNLDLLEELGAELVYFSPLEDEKLPDNLDGLYIGGGFPEVFAEDLQENVTMRASILEYHQSEGPIYAECGGLMYLCRTIENLEEKSFEMVGIFDNESRMTKRLQRFGYVSVNLKENCLLGAEGTSFKAHEFHRSMVEYSDGDHYAYNVIKERDGVETKIWSCGFRTKNVMAAYAHVHFYTNIELAKHFLKACKNFR